MRELDQNLGNEMFNWQQRLFRRSLRRRRKLERITRELGIVTHQTCLEISAGDMMMSCQLKNLGGKWESCAPSERAAEGLSLAGDASVKVYDGRKLPFKSARFDAVVIIDALECIEEDYAFIKECHRVLKDDGRLIINVRKTRSWGLIQSLNRMLGERNGACSRQRAGYVSNQLFDILKDGFDVPGTISYSGFFTELTGAVGAAFIRLVAGPHCHVPPAEAEEEEFYRYQKANLLCALGYPLIWLAAQLDKIFFMLPRYELLAKTKRRVWRPRRIPVLRDGRSIAEAAINTKIGTAAPF